MLPAEIAVGVLALDHNGGGLDARLVALLIVHDLIGEAVALGPAGVHPVEHLGPVLGLGAAGAGVEGRGWRWRQSYSPVSRVWSRASSMLWIEGWRSSPPARAGGTRPLTRCPSRTGPSCRPTRSWRLAWDVQLVLYLLDASAGLSGTSPGLSQKPSAADSASEHIHLDARRSSRFRACSRSSSWREQVVEFDFIFVKLKHRYDHSHSDIISWFIISEVLEKSNRNTRKNLTSPEKTPGGPTKPPQRLLTVGAWVSQRKMKSSRSWTSVRRSSGAVGRERQSGSAWTRAAMVLRSFVVLLLV